MPDPLYLKVNDLQPYYYGEVVDADDNPVDITDATIFCSMKSVADGTLKIDRQSAGITITDGPNGKFRYEWQAGDTDTYGLYDIEFEINPVSGGKFTVPAREKAQVNIRKALDNQ